MKRRTSRWLSILLALCLALALLPGTTWAAEPKVEGLGVASRTIAEIHRFINEHPATLYDPVTYKTEPSLSEPYSAGILSDETETSAQNMLNQARFIAGLHADVTLDERYSYLASAATLVDCLINELTHYPSRPEVLAGAAYDQLYEDGAAGAASSNMGMGYYNLNDAIIHGWCADDDYSNIDRVGHRRWVLNPKMGKTGFGFTDDAEYFRYSAMYALDRSGSGDEYNVAWPAQVMPVEYFSADYPWSLSLGSSVNEDAVSVRLTRRSDNAAWSFSSGASDGAFYVNNANYGIPGCIIFRPDSLSAIETGDVFDVTVTIQDAAQPREIRYSVTFFSLEAPYTADTTYPVTGGSIYFDSAAGIITGCDSSVTEAVIPGEINGIPVTSIGGYAFRKCESLTSVSIPGSVTSIGDGAFYQCSALTSVNIPSGVTSIRRRAFSVCASLTSVTIPAGVTFIGDNAFYGCGALTGVSIPASVTSIGDSAFMNCANLTSVSIPGSVASIGDHAFSRCANLTSVSIQDGVASIGHSAFSNCTGLTSVTIPGSVTSIGKRAFDSCRLTSVSFLDGVTSIGEDTFSYSHDLTSVSIPASVTSIGDDAFASCYSLTDIYYGGSESQWKQINIGVRNDFLLKSAIHYNSPMPSTPSTPAASISVTVNGAAVVWTDATPFIDANDRTMVPLRAVADAMGLDVNWDAAAREASFTGSGKTIYFPIDSTNARTSSGGTVKMDTAAVIVNNRTYAPIRYLAEYFGYTVGWDDATRTVTITG